MSAENKNLFHSYIFFDAPNGLKEVSAKKLAKSKKDFLSALKKVKNIRIKYYSTLGMKPRHRFMLHLNTSSPEEVQELITTLLTTDLGRHLTISYTLMGYTRSSPYNPKKPPAESSPDIPHKYLIVYPFTKTIEWHLLPYEERRNIMKAHVDVGRKYSTEIGQLLLYAYGIDDHEFVVSYQTDNLELFQDLVIELRGTEARRYTKHDTPIFTCIHTSPEKMLNTI
jgi:chlorite dismutase